MSRFIVACVLALFCPEALAQEKPELAGAKILATVTCPDRKQDTCLALRQSSGEYYIVKGNGPGKEEFIWKIDAEGAAKGQDFDSYQKYIILVWSKYAT
jgi:hypothetical protein